MAKGFDVIHAKSAVKSRNKFDLSRTHLTTMNFGQILPLMVEETVPGDKVTVSAEFFSRLAPLVKPTYGKFSFRTASMFIPYHQIAADADAWISGKNLWEGLATHQRYFTFLTLHNYISTYIAKPTVVVNGATITANATNSVYTFVNSSGTKVYNVFTTHGKHEASILNSLGYAFPQGVNLQTSSAWLTNVANTKLSAYPLLAFFKGYNDYMSQASRYNNSPLSSFLSNVKFGNDVTSAFSGSTGELTDTGIYYLFQNLLLNYDNDYFTSAWQSANTAVNGLSSFEPSSLYVPSGRGETVYQDDNSSFVQGRDTDGTYFSLTQRALDFLRSFDDWVRRNHYSGSRSVQQIYSRFGIKIDDYRSSYAHVLGTDILPVQVGDVTATADSTNVPLGDYAGKGIMSGGKTVSFDSTDYGIFIMYGWFTVVPMNPYGFDRRVLRTAPLDYYTPEFDGLGADAISAGEFFANPTVDPTTDTTSDLDVFGFTERYNSYRYGRDLITGEFRDFRNNADMNAWHTGRDLTTVRQAGNLVAQAYSVNTLASNSSQYNRIFSDISDYDDHFYLTAHFNVSAIRPMLNLNQVPQLGEGDTVVPRNGSVIS